ncbi:hypothetical protein INT48_004433 [Thamnidium elegans]|uniref:ERCC4 domain-containing protein n=1 Tax=Thamnidium elegans TaxID=101142 RepID=A0A8H7VWM1_9FUNG|nr:hypothetical protein INT48_004433 [Thamnidium elegans]
MNLEELADQVLAIGTSHSRDHILLDLEFTTCVETTINRIFDGQVISKRNEEEETSRDSLTSIPSSQKKPQSPTPDYSPIINLDLLEDLSPNRFVSPPLNALDPIEPYLFHISDDETPNKPSRKRKTPPNRSVSPVDTIEDDLYSFQASDDDEVPIKPSRKRSTTPNIFSSPVNSIEDDPYSFQVSDDDEAPNKPSRQRSTSFNSISLIDSDSDGSLPSVNDFFDKLMSKKSSNRKGKQRAYEYNIAPLTEPDSELSSAVTSDQELGTFSLSSKEQNKLETEQRKQAQSEERKRALEAKKQKKQELQEEKQRLKDQKLMEKERTSLLERENRIKNDRVKTIKEMIVEMHPDFLKTSTGELVKVILEKKETIIKSASSSNLYHISWRRKCTSEWDENEMIFVPFEKPKIVQEPYVLVYIDVYAFINYVQADTIDAYIDKVQTNADSRQLILLVEGLHAYYKKKINLQRRLFDEQVRSTIEGASSSSRRRNQPEIENGPSQEEIESCIDHLMLERGVMLITTKKDEDSASWIESLTTDLALGRYKSKNTNNSYKVGKRGIHPSDTYSKMLQEIQLCTPAVAQSVIQAYPTLYSLNNTYERKQPSEAELLLSDLER